MLNLLCFTHVTVTVQQYYGGEPKMGCNNQDLPLKTLKTMKCRFFVKKMRIIFGLVKNYIWNCRTSNNSIHDLMEKVYQIPWCMVLHRERTNLVPIVKIMRLICVSYTIFHTYNTSVILCIECTSSTIY